MNESQILKTNPNTDVSVQIELKYHTVMGSEKMMRRPLACRFLGALLREKRRPLWNHRSYISDHCALDRHCNLSSGCVII